MTLSQRIIKYSFVAAIIGLTAIAPSCIDDDDDNYDDWKNLNNQFVEQQAALTNPDGSMFYERITPDWSKGTSILIHWYNDRTKTASGINPLSNSITQFKYKVCLCDGTPVDSSYLRPDSIYSSRPSANIVGWEIAALNMKPGDSCRVVIPANAAYGNISRGVVKPFSALVYEMKFIKISAYESPQ